MNLEEFLRKFGRNYSLSVPKKSGMIRIIVQSSDIDCEDNSQDFFVVDNHVYPIDNDRHDEYSTHIKHTKEKENNGRVFINDPSIYHISLL